MRIPLMYYDLPLKKIQQARTEAQIILNDLAGKGIFDEELEHAIAVMGRMIEWLTERVVVVVKTSRTRKSDIKTRPGGNRRIVAVPPQPSEQANG